MGSAGVKRRICYVTGTRADFGGVEHTLRLALADSRLSMSLCVTGMHLSRRFGLTVRHVRSTGIPILAEIPVKLGGGDGATMSRALGQFIVACTDVFAKSRLDGVFLHGDRGEMLAAAIAAIHLNIPIFHLHGGERTGTVDEPVRHAISKLSHYHFVSSSDARRRLIRMGERADHVFITGAPSLDRITDLAVFDRVMLCGRYGLDPKKPVALVLFHGVLQEADDSARQMKAVLSAVTQQKYQVVCLRPNADAGNLGISETIDLFERRKLIRTLVHAPRQEYLSWLAAADVLVGNSSSGIVEAASFHLPAVNVGSRQNGRLRSGNVLDCKADEKAIASALRQARRLKGRRFRNLYGDGHAGERIVQHMATLSLGADVLSKLNSY
jgi:GDP/UDP-N,N'-diacetylbacillosamine 2-epimerase (hydrolysing)